MSEQNSASSNNKGKRLPEDWNRSKVKEWEQQQNLDPKWLDFEEEKFRDHWLAAAGQNARKRDWDAAWRNWVRKAAGGRPLGRPPATPEATRDRKARETQALKDLFRRDQGQLE